MNSNTITPRDLELLSAYTDGALNARQRAQMEQRLNADPALSTALRKLESTRNLLRRAPQRKAPRAFTLTRQMAGIPQASPRGWSVYSFASVAAVLLLAVVTAGDIWAGGQFFGPTAANEDINLMVQMAPEGGMAADSMATPEAALAPEATPEPALELYAEEAEGERAMKGSDTPADLQSYILVYARPIEFVLLVVAIIAGLVAWNRRKFKGSQ